MIPPGVLLACVVGLAAVGRVALQLVDHIGFALAVVPPWLRCWLLSLAPAIRRHCIDGGLAAAVAVTTGVAADVAVRATDATWDVVWRQDLVGWTLNRLSVGLIAVLGRS